MVEFGGEPHLNSRIEFEEPWRPPSFADIFFSRVIIDVFTYGFPLVILAFLVENILPVDRLDFTMILGLVIASILIQALIGSVVFGWFARAQSHPSPGSFWLLCSDLAIASSAGFLAGGFLSTPGNWNLPWAIFLSSLTFFVAVVHSIFWDKQWKQGMSHAEIRRKVAQTQRMTDDILRDGHK
ncbi:MAG: hypothetical protein Q4C81_01815 [Kocuria sp.]|nr:hypothetical protein [Kocuria sp.]